MSIEVKVPVLPESVSDATIASWHKKAGDAVKRDENLVDLETDKVVLEVPSPVDGVLKEIRQQEGDTVNSQQVIAVIEEGAAAPAPAVEAPKAAASAAAAPAPAAPKASGKGTEDLSPAGLRVATEEKIDPSKVSGTGRDGRVTKEDLVNYGKGGAAAAPAAKPTPGSRPEERVPMTRMRAKIAERLMQSKNSIAMLTSFNEVNLAEVVKMRKSLGERFQKTHGIKLGFMSFFVKATAEAPPDRQRIGRRQRHHLSRLPGHLDRRVHRERSGHAGTARRAGHGLRRYRAGHRRLCEESARRQAEPRRPAGRHVHDHERRHVRVVAVHADRESAAERDSGHAHDQGSRHCRERTGDRRTDDVHRNQL
jgi:hypothetical protein